MLAFFGRDELLLVRGTRPEPDQNRRSDERELIPTGASCSPVLTLESGSTRAYRLRHCRYAIDPLLIR
jgi:hypothetical protein